MDAWKEDCKRLVEIIMKHADSEPFRQPVDLREHTVSFVVDLSKTKINETHACIEFKGIFECN